MSGKQTAKKVLEDVGTGKAPETFEHQEPVDKVGGAAGWGGGDVPLTVDLGASRDLRMRLQSAALGRLFEKSDRGAVQVFARGGLLVGLAVLQPTEEGARRLFENDEGGMALEILGIYGAGSRPLYLVTTHPHVNLGDIQDARGILGSWPEFDSARGSVPSRGDATTTGEGAITDEAAPRSTVELGDTFAEASLGELEAALVPTVTDAARERLEALLADARDNQPEDPEGFVRSVNRILDAQNLRFRVGDNLARLLVRRGQVQYSVAGKGGRSLSGVDPAVESVGQKYGRLGKRLSSSAEQQAQPGN